MTLILGEDCLKFYFTKERAFKNLYVSKRDLEANKPQDIPPDYKVEFFTPDCLNLSSTKIRNYLAKHPYLFEAKDIFLSASFIAKHLDPQVAGLIFEKKHYFVDNEKRLNSIKSKISLFVQSHFQKHTLICLTDIGEGGRSGNLAFKVNCEQPTFIKVYVKPTQSQESYCEANGIK